MPLGKTYSLVDKTCFSSPSAPSFVPALSPTAPFLSAAPIQMDEIPPSVVTRSMLKTNVFFSFLVVIFVGCQSKQAAPPPALPPLSATEDQLVQALGFTPQQVA